MWAVKKMWKRYIKEKSKFRIKLNIKKNKLNIAFDIFFSDRNQDGLKRDTKILKNTWIIYKLL